MNNSPERSPLKKTLGRALVAATMLFAQPMVPDGPIVSRAHAEETSSESGSAQLIKAIEVTAQGIPAPVYEKDYPGRNEAVLQGSTELFKRAIASARVAGFNEDAKLLIDMSRRDNNLFRREAGYFSLVYVRGLHRDNIDPASNFAPAREAPMTILENTVTDPARPGQARQQLYVVVNPFFSQIANNDIRMPFSVSRIAEYIRVSHAKLGELISEGASDPDVLHQKMLSPEVQSELAKKSRSHAARATLRLLSSETGQDWSVQDTFKGELEAMASGGSENVASDDAAFYRQLVSETSSN